MTVYVDNAKIPYRRMKMCHMVSDNLEELHKMADMIGINRRWFQGRASTPHYDICLSKKKMALENGAIEVTRRELVKLLKSWRES